MSKKHFYNTITFNASYLKQSDIIQYENNIHEHYFRVGNKH